MEVDGDVDVLLLDVVEYLLFVKGWVVLCVCGGDEVFECGVVLIVDGVCVYLVV